MGLFSLSPRIVVLCLLCGLLPIVGSGCSLGTQSATGDLSPKRGGGVQLFTPMTQAGAVRLSAGEAAKLVSSMSPQSQGLSSWRELDFAVSQSLAHAAGRPADNNAVDQPGLQLTYGKMAATLQHLRSLLPKLDANPALLTTEFNWYRIGPDFGITGYYEPTLEASRTKSSKYNYPIYRVPPDLRSGVPYHTRNAIDRKGALAGRGLEIAWVTSETDAFFLHIQGSGRLRFADGSVTHVLFAAKNNQAYVPLGRVLRDEGLLAPDNVNMPSIRKCIKENPRRQAEFFDKNPSYIFFREAEKGPLGAMGRPLTSWVSTATDRKVLPHGLLVFLTVPLPDKDGNMTVPFNGLTLPQDVGGAIKGNRTDFFCGPGERAEHVAGYLNAKGATYILVKK